MCSDVDRQGTPLDERFAAVVIAYIWPLICVDAVVPLQVRLAVETLLAALAKLEGMTSRKHTFLQSGSGQWKGRRIFSAIFWSLSLTISRRSIPSM